MIWPFLPLLAGYLLGAWIVWWFTGELVGESRIGRKCLPFVAAFWFIVLPLLIAIGMVGAVDAAFREAADRTFGPDDPSTALRRCSGERSGRAEEDA